ncbi:CHAP domain-containing protein [Streptacidiphilus rugosus]|uniref:CHAP domain-containing protein n=1 Tax=Streptacidiphilus rugosus TaxID=405783 RepID=UPI00056C076A|nr:CHAP domain-containing protein [Streptacidiphilus rugosus]
MPSHRFTLRALACLTATGLSGVALLGLGAAPASATTNRSAIVSAAVGQIGDNGCSPNSYYGSCSQEWCADFARWAWSQGGVDVSALGATVTTFVNYGDNNGTWHDPGSYTPQPGDAMIFGGSGYPTKASGGAHVGLVVSVSGSTITEIGGNQSGTVSEITGTAAYIESQLEGGYNFLGYVSPVGAIPAGFNVTAHAQQSGSTVNLTSTVTANGYVNYVNYVITGPGGYNQTFRAGGGPTNPNTTGYAYAWNTSGLASGTYSIQPVANETDGANHTYAATTVQVSSGMARLVSGDFLNNGRIDIAGIDANNNLKLYTNDGTGHLSDSGVYMLGNTGLWAGFKQITAGDFLNNGRIDIAGIDANNNLKLYTNDGTGHLSDSGIYMLGNTGLWGGFKQIVAGDFLNNGRIDIAGIDANNNLKLYTNDGTGHLSDSGVYMLGNTGLWAGFKQITAGDFLNNGRIDIAGIDANNNLKLYTNDGTGHLSDSGVYMLGNTGLWGGFRSVVAGNYLGDGRISVAGIDANNNLKLYTNDGTGHLSDSGIYMLGNTGLWAGFGS